MWNPDSIFTEIKQQNMPVTKKTATKATTKKTTKTKSVKGAPKLNIQHDYISLKLPTGTFTTSFRGAKCSGELCEIKGAFKALDTYVQTTAKTKSIGEAMNDLLNPKLLDKLVPGWDKPKVIDTFTAGEKLQFTSELFSKKYPGKHEVVKTNYRNKILRKLR